MFLLWIHKTWTIFYFWQYTFLFCLFVFIHFSCSWVTKYLECESLCSSCTRTEIIAMIIKKNMTKLYMHHFRGGLVYCCIVTHEIILFLKPFHRNKVLFCAQSTVCAFFLCLYHYLICLICKLTFTEKKGFICQYLKLLQACVQDVIFSLQRFLTLSDGTALCTAHRYEYSTPMHK